MLTVNNRNLCEHCFAEVPKKTKKCPYCSGERNRDKYPTALTEGVILVGRYAVGRVLGKGGFGITYLCYDLKEDKMVAVKEYLPDSLTHRNSGDTVVSSYGDEREEYFRTGARKFYDEAKLVSRFNGNPNIISVYEFFFENNTTYFVMEYLDGVDFKNYIAECGGKINENEAVYIMDRLTEALMIVHSTDVLHRDISPDNIFLCRNGDIKLIDFGAARQVIEEVSKSLSVILKQGFAPLEQYQRRGKQGPWTDIYALGATMYYALTGMIPDDAMSRLDDASLDPCGISPELMKILEKMLAVRAKERYQNVVELKADLQKLEADKKAPVITSKTEVRSFCRECGKEIEAGTHICPQCEHKSHSKSESHQGDDEGNNSGESPGGGETITGPGPITGPNGSGRKKRIIILCICVLAAGLIIGLTARQCSRKNTVHEIREVQEEDVISEEEKEAIESGLKELNENLTSVKEILEKAQQDGDVDHEHFVHEEEDLVSAIEELENKIDAVERLADLEEAEEYYANTVSPAAESLTNAYNEAVQMAEDAKAAEQAEPTEAPAAPTNNNSSSSSSGGTSSGSKPSGGTSKGGNTGGGTSTGGKTGGSTSTSSGGKTGGSTSTSGGSTGGNTSTTSGSSTSSGGSTPSGGGASTNSGSTGGGSTSTGGGTSTSSNSSSSEGSTGRSVDSLPDPQGDFIRR
ncbi:MAG: protein kinase [Oscillospiraceae bacterium]|nr:protein kinase [Oscillospiraceae bacterium]